MNFLTRNSKMKILPAVPTGATGEKFLKIDDFFVNFHLNGIKNRIILAKKSKTAKRLQNNQKGGKCLLKEAKRRYWKFLLLYL